MFNLLTNLSTDKVKEVFNRLRYITIEFTFIGFTVILGIKFLIYCWRNF